MRRFMMLGAVLLACCATSAQAELDKTTFKVVGTWGSLSHFHELEKPFFVERLSKVSDGKINAEIIPYDRTGLSSADFVQLLHEGKFHFGMMTMCHLAHEIPEIDGLDLAGLSQSYTQSRAIADAYMPVVQEAIDQQGLNLLLLEVYPFPTQVLFCRLPVESLEDLAGKRVRTYSDTLTDFVEGAGGTSIRVPFAEVVPQLKSGALDCAITGTSAGWQVGWSQVATHMYGLGLGFGMNGVFADKARFEALNSRTQDLIASELRTWSREAWAFTADEDRLGVKCATKTGDWRQVCPQDKVHGMTLTEAASHHHADREKILYDHVLPKFKARCGADCARRWNETAGQVIGIAIP